jgi:hypothetical protein
MSQKSWGRVPTVSYGRWSRKPQPYHSAYDAITRSLVSLEISNAEAAKIYQCSAATNSQTGEGVAIKKVTNVFSKKILAKRALREIKLLQHFRGHRNVWRPRSCGSP